ncbi:MAG: hypothetical protein ACTSQD_08540, partial [Promethearchaeota archaeon]
EEFSTIFKTGNEDAIKEMLDKYPWLLSEVSSEMDSRMSEQNQIVAAIGVMEDELGGPASMDDIMLSLNADFNIRKSKEELQPLILNNEDLNLIKKEGNGWILTDEGGRVCDAFLNKNLKEFEL